MHLIGTKLALPLLWPDWFTLGETGFSLAGSCFDWQLWHWLQWWRGGTSHRGWYYRKRGRQRLHTHTHKYKYRHTLAPSFCPLQSGGSPSSYAPMFPRGGQTCCAIRSSSHPFSPPPSLLSPNLIISHALVSPSLLPTAIPPGLGILKVFSWFQGCDLPQKSSLFLQTALLILLPSYFSHFFPLTPQTWCSLSCQKFCIGIKLGVFRAKARSFQWQYCCRRLYLVKNTLWDLASHVISSPCGCRAFWNTKKHQFQIKQIHFICSTSTVYCPWK